MKKYNDLNKQHQFLSEFDFDKMDTLDFIFYQTFNRDRYDEEIEPMLQKLTDAIKDARLMIERDCQQLLINYNKQAHSPKFKQSRGEEKE